MDVVIVKQTKERQYGVVDGQQCEFEVSYWDAKRHAFICHDRINNTLGHKVNVFCGKFTRPYKNKQDYDSANPGWHMKPSYRVTLKLKEGMPFKENELVKEWYHVDFTYEALDGMINQTFGDMVESFEIENI